MARYQKKATVVEATQMTSDRNLGVLGTVESNDWMIITADGSLHSMTSEDFASKYTNASASTALTGDQWS